MEQKLDLPFWLKVQEEYLSSENIYLCVASNTFEEAWCAGLNEDIVKLAEEFLTSYSNYKARIGKDVRFKVLFITDTRDTSIEAVRKDFLSWIINKFQNI